MAEEKNLGGRPRLYDNPEDLEARINQYFENCPDTRPVVTKEGVFQLPAYTITGLALFCGFCDRASFYDYEKNDKFSYTIKRARTLIEKHYESHLMSNTATGAIFALKNFGWKDKTEVEQAVSVTTMPTIKLRNGKDLELKVGEDPDS